MSVQPENPAIPASRTQPRRIPKRTLRARVNVEDEDDDWTPYAAAITPARAASEFFDNDYDVM